MKKHPLMAALKADLIATFEASGLTRYALAKRAGIAPNNVERMLDPYTGAQIDTLDRAFRALGKRIELRTIALLVALLPLAATAQAPHTPQACAVNATAVIHTYTGPIVIDQLCMTVTSHASIPNSPPGAPGQTLRFEARDMGDGLFRDGFDGAQP